MSKMKKLRLAKWEKTTKLISVSLTIMQLGNMSIPLTMNYASAAETLMEQSRSEDIQQSNSVGNNVYEMETHDTTAPEVMFKYEEPGGYLGLNFNEPIRQGGGYLRIYDQANGQEVAWFFVSGSTYATGYNIPDSSMYESQAYFSVQGLEKGHTYNVKIDSGMFRDLSGNKYAGTGEAGWSFKIANTQMPELLNKWIHDNGAGEKAKLEMLFNKELHFGQEGAIRIYRSADDSVQQSMTIHDGELSGASYTWFSGHRILQLEPNRLLEDSTEYYVTATSGALVDESGRGMMSLVKSNNWNFRTSDQTAPQAELDYAEMSGQLRVKFTEPVRQGGGYLRIYDQANGQEVAWFFVSGSAYATGYNIPASSVYENQAQFSVQGLEKGHTYNVKIDSGMFRDLSGNKYAGTSSTGWIFHTTAVSATETKPDKKATSSTGTAGGGGSVVAPVTPPVISLAPQPGSGTDASTVSNPSASNTGTDKIKTPATTTSMLVEPQLASSGTVSLPAPVAPTANTFVHYYDAKWDKWIAVPTTSDGTTLKADVPAGSWTSVINSEQAVKPADVVKSWAVAPVMKLMSLGIVQGDTQGNYNPKQAINRYEMAVILAKTLRLDVNALSQGSPASSANTPDWAQPYVQAVVSQGIMTGNSDSFNGNGQVTREQLATLIGRMLPDSATTGTPATNVTFKDASKMSTWAVQGIAKVQALGLMKGYDDQNFRPKQAVTREEMAAVIAKVVDML